MGIYAQPYTSGIGAAFGKIVSGTKTVTTSGTAVQVTSTSTPIPGVWVSSDTGNTNVIVVGDSNVVAAPGSQRGIVLFSGNPSVFIAINNLNLLWVDVATSGEKLCYAYLQPSV